MTIVIVGAGGHGREVLDVVEACGLDVAGFVDDGTPDLEPLRRRSATLLGGLDAVPIGAMLLLGIGDGAARRSVVARMPSAAQWAGAVAHPLSSQGSDVELGDGTVLTAGARLTTHIRAGIHCYVGPNVTIGHDAELAPFVTVLPGATISGNVSVGEAATIGTGANVRQGIVIGAEAVVGAGAVVVSDVAPGSVVAGVPARPLR